MITRFPLLLALLITLFSGSLTWGAGAAQPAQAVPPSLEDISKRCGLDSQELERLRSGEIIYQSAPDTRANQLFVSAFFLLQTPLADFESQIRAGRIINTSQSALASTPIQKQILPQDITPILDKTLTDQESQRYLDAAPGVSLNLSPEEISRLQSIKPGPTPLRESMIVALDEILSKRLNEYFLSGIKGLPPYTRGKSESRVGTELLAAAELVPEIIGSIPSVKDSISLFPAETPAHGEELFQLICQEVENRPDYIMSHFSFYKPDEFSFMSISRQFYVSHSYNSLMIVTGAVETEAGLLVFYYNSTFTDMVTGLISGVKKSVGQSRMRGNIEKQMTEFRASFQ